MPVSISPSTQPQGSTFGSVTGLKFISLGVLLITPQLGPYKTHTRQMAQTSGLDPKDKIKACFDHKMFNWIAHLNGEDGLRDLPSHETLSVASQGALEISSVTRHPPS